MPTTLKSELLTFEKDELEKFLKSIKELGIIDFNTICFILDNSTYEVISNINTLIKDGALTLDFILYSKELLSIDNNKNNYTTLLNKIQLFKTEGINYRLLIYDLDIYLIDYQKLSYNINVLKQYNFLFGLNKLTSFALLKDNDLETKIDLFLELGYEKALEENLVLLNFDTNKIRKLYILKSMGLLPTDTVSLISVIENKNFLDCIDDIDSYIFNIVNYRIDNKLIDNKELDINKYFLFDNNSRVIEIGGIVLSKNRIKRNILK